MMSTVRVTYYGVEGEGRNVTEAKRDAGHRIERFVRQSMPRVYSHRGHTLIAYATEYGGSYSIAHPDSDGAVIGSSSCASKDDAEQSGIAHMLTMARAEGEFEVPEWAAHRLGRDAVAKLTREWRDNDVFQTGYREARAQGMGDCDAHAYACRARWSQVA